VYSGGVVAAGSLARVLLFGIPVYLYFYSSLGPGRERLSLRPLYWAAVIAALFACVDFYYQFPAPAGYGPQFVWLDSGVYRRAQGLFYEASTLGNFCAFLVMIAVAFLAAGGVACIARRAGGGRGDPDGGAGASVFTASLIGSDRSGGAGGAPEARAVVKARLRRRALWPRGWSLSCRRGGWRLGIGRILLHATEAGRVASWRTGRSEANPGKCRSASATRPYTSHLGAPRPTICTSACSWRRVSWGSRP
jgi:hypothetical protein